MHCYPFLALSLAVAPAGPNASKAANKDNFAKALTAFFDKASTRPPIPFHRISELVDSSKGGTARWPWQVPYWGHRIELTRGCRCVGAQRPEMGVRLSQTSRVL